MANCLVDEEDVVSGLIGHDLPLECRQTWPRVRAPSSHASVQKFNNQKTALQIERRKCHGACSHFCFVANEDATCVALSCN